MRTESAILRKRFSDENRAAVRARKSGARQKKSNDFQALLSS